MKMECFQIFNQIYSYLEPSQKRKVFLGLLAKVFFTFLSIINALLYSYFIKNVISARDMNGLLIVVPGFLIMFSIESIILHVQTLVVNKIYSLMCISIRNKIWDVFVHLPQTEIERRGSGELKNLFDDDVNYFESFISKHWWDYILGIVKMIVYGVIFLKLNILMGVIGMISIPIILLITKFFSEKTQTVEEKSRSLNAQYSNWLDNDFRGWKEIRTLNAENSQTKKFIKFWDQMLHITNWSFVYNFLNRSMITVKDFLVLRVGTYMLGGYLIFNNKFTIVALLIFIQYFELFMGCVDQISSIHIGLASDKVHVYRVFDILSRSIKNKIEINRIEEIELQNVSFKYEGQENYALKQLSFKLNNMSGLVCIVGPSGSGKSTLAKLLLGLYSTNEGCININGKNIEEYSTSNLYVHMGCVFQDSKLFNATIMENLMLSNDNISEEEIINACKMVNLHDLIMNFPEQYNTMINEGSNNISGGQKQRILIARTILQNTQVIIWDEAMSMIDSDNCKNIIAKIKYLWKDRLLISITHKVSDVLNADRIIVISDGCILTEGTHKSLYNNDEFYTKLFKEQLIDFKIAGSV